MDDKITIQVRVTAYIPNAMRDEFDDGTFAVYDATLLQVIDPHSLLGKQLTVCHNQPMPTDSHWRAVGCSLQFSILKEFFEEGAILFDGAIQELHVIDDNR